MLETDLYQLLSTDAGVARTVNGVNCVWLGSIPKGQPDSPSIVVQVTRSQRFKGADGTNRFTMKQVQIDARHAQYSQALSIAEAIRLLLQDLAGGLMSTNVAGVLIEKDMDMGVEPGDSGYVYRRLMEFHFWYTDGAGAVPFVAIAAPVAGANAAYLEGIPISNAAPSVGQALVYGSDGKWEPGSAAAANAPTHHTLVGTIDGNNKNFILSPSFTRTILFQFRNGEFQNSPADYSRVGDNITFVVAPSAGPPADILDAYSF